MKLDVELSQEVAKKASEEINNTKKELENNKDAYIHFLKDVFNDAREHTKFLKKIIICFIVTLIILVGGTIGVTIYNQNAIRKMADDSIRQFTDFVEAFDFYSEVQILNELSDDNENNLVIHKR